MVVTEKGKGAVCKFGFDSDERGVRNLMCSGGGFRGHDVVEGESGGRAGGVGCGWLRGWRLMVERMEWRRSGLCRVIVVLRCERLMGFGYSCG